jgi:hypothetical protein
MTYYYWAHCGECCDDCKEIADGNAPEYKTEDTYMHQNSINQSFSKSYQGATSSCPDAIRIEIYKEIIEHEKNIKHKTYFLTINHDVDRPFVFYDEYWYVPLDIAKIKDTIT